MNVSGKFIPKFSSMRCFTVCIAIIFIFFITNKGYCQSENAHPIYTTGVAKDSIKTTDSIKIINDSSGLETKIKLDSLKKDSLATASDTSKRRMLEASLGIKISKD